MMRDMCALERNLASGEAKWCDEEGKGRIQPGNCIPKDVVEGVTVGCFPDFDFYAAFADNPPNHVITL